ncbi:tetratricopeptide repeat protein [Syntrophobacter fumaroxidans]|uniref:Tetratricopeptide TPR_2 repeat protein n=1 Tax=Syntrophobacter fumaroxidans (strain DSM 10017 / MPOB) TaxID=335543 RepID=A0LIQ1_SYNFM|nr:tetratricopeptide repeat protein [Syntrophobacter fumaroxidans]ABK17303.1 Tetratricopeptide TPR_2 repeat protein [Syntrophobacter fumaroxidans MPOB]
MKGLKWVVPILLAVCAGMAAAGSFLPVASGAQSDPQKAKVLEPISSSDLKPVPVPKLDNLEKAVREQLEEEQKKVDTAVATRSAGRQECAQAYVELGEMYHAYQLNDAAEACYRNALTLDPTRVEWNYNLAFLLQSVGRYPEAIELYGKVWRTQPDSYVLPIRVAECHKSLNQLKEAKDALEAAWRINPDGPAVLARMGEIALEEKRYEDAVKFLSSALDKQPAANLIHYQLAMAYRGLGDAGKAREHLAQRGIVGLQPPDPLKERLDKLVTGYRVHVLTGRRAYGAGRFEEAAEAFQRAVDANPDDVGARINLAAALAGLQKVREAMEQLQEAIRLSPQNSTAHFNLGLLRSHMGEYAESIKHFRIALEARPNDHQAHAALADALVREGKFGEAFDQYKAAVDLEPNLTAAWLQMSTMLTVADQHAEALAVLAEAHRRVPKNGPIKHAIARQLAASPELRLRDGRRALEMAMEVYGERANHEHARTVAMAHAETDQCGKAVEWQERALSLAKEESMPPEVMVTLNKNLDHFKTQRPCRVPGKQ